MTLMTWVFGRALELRMDLALLMGSSWIKVFVTQPTNWGLGGPVMWTWVNYT